MAGIKQMTSDQSRRFAAAARKAAETAGYYVREGSYQGTTDDRLGRWYVCHTNDEVARLYGPGHASQTAAWLAAAEEMVRV